ncbi:hypothetical protein TraAM80_04779 [Trypanosoma rangeli]|uniref:Uncharacterized protein n=1 Tax=Trypanosoma rangeli TaxID=5698 RepID=A0A422NHY8_TRYRA|nr:uncharacterized protein TraAM80_04779 [Trypanosoma rangeli]RNF05059.1 hypothetical protein TraAM80_04779 [Trypanosoma rangeli]|eukprot:RNF05059.1 hypothetical protein TraAM80_04779 [Trypanosoma rangeli]
MILSVNAFQLMRFNGDSHQEKPSQLPTIPLFAAAYLEDGAQGLRPDGHTASWELVCRPPRRIGEWKDREHQNIDVPSWGYEFHTQRQHHAEESDRHVGRVPKSQ